MRRPGPTQPNTAPNCNKWFLVQKGDDCSTAEKAGNITPDQFFKWNPSVSKDCLHEFLAFVCVLVSASGLL